MRTATCLAEGWGFQGSNVGGKSFISVLSIARALLIVNCVDIFEAALGVLWSYSCCSWAFVGFGLSVGGDGAGSSLAVSARIDQ